MQANAAVAEERGGLALSGCGVQRGSVQRARREDRFRGLAQSKLKTNLLPKKSASSLDLVRTWRGAAVRQFRRGGSATTCGAAQAAEYMCVCGTETKNVE